LPGPAAGSLAGTLALTGCTPGADSPGLLAVAVVAVALGGLAAALAYALGRRSAAPTPAGPRSGPAPASEPVPGGASPTPGTLLADALPCPALLLVAGAEGWRLHHANAAARRDWPALDTTAPGSDGWPAGLQAHLGTAAAGDGAAPHWDSLAVPATPGAPRWLLAWQTPAGGEAVAADGGEAARRQAASDSFGFTLSHDLRAPLRVVEGFTRIVKEDYGPQLDRVGNDHLERVLGAAARMNLMIDAMLALARLSQQPLTRQPVNLSQLAGFVVEDLRRAEPEHAVEVELDPDLAVQGDPTLLRLVLENLLGNAWKYSAKALAPRVELRREAAPAGQLGFLVRDNGAGFDMRSADRLFGLFQRLHSASDFPGHGVGLASVRRIVERHGGRVWAESEPGKGASFHVVLPA
jgi:signal transduction histidine kinase